MTPIEFNALIQTGGIVGVLGLITWFFLAGKVLPANVVEKQIASITELAKLTLTAGFEKAIHDAVKSGVLEAWVEFDKHRGK
jgi:hypothetical protein